MTKLTKAPPKLSPGRHTTRLHRVTVEEHAQWGPGLRWVFAGCDGQESWVWTGLEWIPGNSLDKLLEKLLDDESPTGAEVDPQDFVDHAYDVTVDRDGRIVAIKPAVEA